MKQLTLLISISLSITSYAHPNQFKDGDAYAIVANPGQNARNEIRINWHTDLENTKSFCQYTLRCDTSWLQAKTVMADQQLCTTFDGIYSKGTLGEDFYENARFLRCTVSLLGLEPGSEYMYRVGENQLSEAHFFKTAPLSGVWSMGIIADIHTYSPLPKRLEAAMEMIGTLENQNGGEVDFMLHVGDVCAWGGSHSFWTTMYAQPHFAKYVWAGVNGNHDDMARGYAKQTNEYFRYVNSYPQNGYEGEEGVCYYFTYDNALFIMLNNENMRDEEGLSLAQEWVKEVITNNSADYIIVVEHYQWFFGEDGKDSHYARWKLLFDEYKVDLAISANNHIYVRTNALYGDCETDGTIGTVYIQAPSSDNERGMEMREWTSNKDIIKYRWTEGGNTVGAILMQTNPEKLHLILYDRYGNNLDEVSVLKKYNLQNL
ncbi:MAG: metallophosphoesterase family protein [Prevotellaceae bacterium]|jgi:hypothetical protein|nr:metallophosphoesterase family protein [Prevotellaceae bacterium]